VFYAKSQYGENNSFPCLNGEQKKKNLLVFRKPQDKAVASVTIYNSAVICSNMASDGLILFGEVGKAFLESKAE